MEAAKTDPAQARSLAMSQMIIARQQPGTAQHNPGASPNNDEEDVPWPQKRSQQAVSAH